MYMVIATSNLQVKLKAYLLFVSLNTVEGPLLIGSCDGPLCSKLQLLYLVVKECLHDCNLDKGKLKGKLKVLVSLFHRCMASYVATGEIGKWIITELAKT